MSNDVRGPCVDVDRSYGCRSESTLRYITHTHNRVRRSDLRRPESPASDYGLMRPVLAYRSYSYSELSVSPLQLSPSRGVARRRLLHRMHRLDQSTHRGLTALCPACMMHLHA